MSQGIAHQLARFKSSEQQVGFLHEETQVLLHDAARSEVGEFNRRSLEIQHALGQISTPRVRHAMQFVFRGMLVEPLPEGHGVSSVDELKLYTINRYNYPIRRPARISRHERMLAYPFLGMQLYPIANQKKELLLTNSISATGTRTAIGTDPAHLPELVSSIRVIDTL